MKLESKCLIAASPRSIWDLMMDIPHAAFCVPGMEELVSDGDDLYRVRLRARVGPISLTFSVTIQLVEQDPSQYEARFRVEGTDRSVGGSFKSDMTLRLSPQLTGQTELAITADTTFMGKLGEFGQPIIRRKAGSTIQQFANNLAQQLNSATG